MDLNEYIIQYCKQHKISKDKLAKRAHIARSTLYRIMDGGSSPTLLNLTKLAAAMQVHPQYLIKLEWQKYQLNGFKVDPIEPLAEPKRWFHEQPDNAYFVTETVPDGSIVCINERFSKTWRIQNTGDTIWKDRRLQCQSVEDVIQDHPAIKSFTVDLSFQITPVVSCIEIPTTKPGDTVDLTVDFIAPAVPASVFSYWKMINQEGNLCFPDCIGLYLQVQVVSAGAASNNTNLVYGK